jgi:hypothetical protein
MTSPFSFPLGNNGLPNGSESDDSYRSVIPEHAEAFAEYLERAALRARSGEAVSEIADDILLPIQIAARRI